MERDGSCLLGLRAIHGPVAALLIPKADTEKYQKFLERREDPEIGGSLQIHLDVLSASRGLTPMSPASPKENVAPYGTT